MTFFPLTSRPPFATIHTFNTAAFLAAIQMGGTTFSFATTWPNSNVAFYFPIALDANYIIQKFFWTNGSSVANNIDVGLYTQDGTLLVHTGSVAQSGTSTLQSASVTPFEVAPGMYYLAISCNGASANFYASKPGAAFLNTTGIYTQASAFPLPATASFAAPASNNILPLVGFTTMGVI